MLTRLVSPAIGREKIKWNLLNLDKIRYLELNYTLYDASEGNPSDGPQDDESANEEDMDEEERREILEPISELLKGAPLVTPEASRPQTTPDASFGP